MSLGSLLDRGPSYQAERNALPWGYSAGKNEAMPRQTAYGYYYREEPGVDMVLPPSLLVLHCRDNINA